MGRHKKIKAFDVPENVLNMINECSDSGWILCNYDNLNQFRIYCNFDNPYVMKSLKSDITNWLNAMSHIETQSTLHGILGNNGGPTDEDIIG